MTLQEDMDSKRNWTQDEIDALKSKYKRTHFDHFNGLDLKPQRSKVVRGVVYVWMFGAWRRKELKNRRDMRGGLYATQKR